MRLLRTLAFLFCALSCALAARQNSQQVPPAALSPVTAYALDRQKVTLPADFAAPLNLLILSFERDQQSAVDDWFNAATQTAATQTATPRAQTWMLLVSPRANMLYRWWINASMRGSLAANQPRHNSVPLYVDKPHFLQSLQVSSEQNVVLLVTDRAGHVLWRTDGPVTDSKKAALSSFLTKSSAH